MAEINSIGIPLFPLIPQFGGSGLTNIPLNSLIVGNVLDPYLTINPGTNGQVLIGASGQIPAFATLTSTGGTITFTTGPNSLNLEVSGGGGTAITWNNVTSSSVSASINNGYVINNATTATVTLPATAAIGSVIYIVGNGAGEWVLAQNAGQIVNLGQAGTTIGVGGSLSATDPYDSIGIVCTTANTRWVAFSAIGNLGVI